MQKKEGVTLSFWVSQDVANRLGVLAEKAGISRSKLLSNMAELNLKSLEKADSFGLLSLSLLLRDFEENMKGWVRMIRDEGKGVADDWKNGLMDIEEWDKV